MQNTKLILLLMALLLSAKAFSQSGCLLPDGRVYTKSRTFIIFKMYEQAPAVTLPSGYCSWSPHTGNSCNVCFGTFNVVSLVCIGQLVSGIENNFSPIACPIDDYSLPMAVAVAGFSIQRMLGRRKKQK